MRRGYKSNSSNPIAIRAELAEHNLALSQEIRRREAIETDLQRQSEALDKTNLNCASPPPPSMLRKA